MDAAVKNAEISRRILERVTQGMSLAAAFDAVLGAGSYASLVSDLYDTFNA